MPWEPTSSWPVYEVVLHPSVYPVWVYYVQTALAVGSLAALSLITWSWRRIAGEGV